MFDNVRRVVTVLGDDGVSRFESDGAPVVTRRLPNARTAIDEIWRFPSLPADATAPGDEGEFSFLSPEQGFVVRRVEVPPDTEKFVDKHGEPRTPEPHEGMHQTATIDIIQMLEGELWCLLDSGEETCLHAGDVLVQRGTVHAWRNRTDRPVRYLALMMSATLPGPIVHHANP